VNTLSLTHLFTSPPSSRHTDYKGIEDWKRFVYSVDDSRFIALRTWARALSVQAVTLCDALVKNWRLVEKPKGDEDAGSAMY
jgi:Proteasome activator PA28, C-terminal